MVAAHTSNEYLTRDEFYIAIRLIAYAQKGMRCDAEAIMFDLPLDFPDFTDDAPAIMAAPKAPPTPSMADLPDLDKLDFANPQTLSNLNQSSFSTMQQPPPQQTRNQPPPKNPQSMQQTTMDSIWRITE